MTGRWRVEPAGRGGPAGRGSSSAAPSTKRCSGTARSSSSAAAPFRSAGSARTSSTTRPTSRRSSSGCGRRRRARGRRCDPRPAHRRGDREPLEGRSALGRAGLALAAARRCGGSRAARGPRRGAPADADPGGRNAPAPSRLPPRRSRVPPLRHGDPLAPAGRRRADRVLVPRLPAQRRRARRTASLAVVGKRLRCDLRSLRHVAPLLPRRLRPLPPGHGRRRRPPVRLRGARLVRTADPLRVPAARARLHRGARGTALSARRRARRGRRPPARAGGADLRPRPRGPFAGRGAALYRSVLVPLLVANPRRAAAASTGRRRLRPRVHGARRDPSSATATPTARSRRSSASPAGP